MKQQMHMSKVLSNVVAGTTASSSSETTCPSCFDSQNTGKQPMALFSGAVIQGGNFSIHINTVNQSSTLTTNPSSPEAARWKRLRPLELEIKVTLMITKYSFLFITLRRLLA